jgi:hypothetical protein
MHCRECGTVEFVFPASPELPSQQNVEPVVETDPECDVPPNGEAALCTYCLFPNLPEASWCKRCGASVSFASIVGPVDAARASGFMWRGALRGRPTRFILVSVWLLFFPKLILNLLAAFSILMSGISGLVGMGFFWAALAYAAISFVMLYQVTKNYLTIPPTHWDETESAS